MIAAQNIQHPTGKITVKNIYNGNSYVNLNKGINESFVSFWGILSFGHISELIFLVTDNFEEPFPDGWQQVVKNTGEIYFIDYNSGTTSWFDPRILCMYIYWVKYICFMFELVTFFLLVSFTFFGFFH